ncbi:MAG: pilus assembly protein [Sphingomonadaceae bacterium]|nr:pilus assembly protein [Sphingomonadaceae bacterium]
MIGGRLLRRLRDCTRGVALTEFALCVPVLLVLYLGGVQISDAIACNRKVTITSRAVADLISQNATMSSSQINTVLNASTQVMVPYPASRALVRVSELTTDGSGNTTVTWSEAINGSRRTLGSSFTLPPAIKLANSSLIYSEVAYAYQPRISLGFIKPLSLTQTVYMVPRVSSSITETP